jgi:ATP-dependent RNA helicase DOB1
MRLVLRRLGHVDADGIVTLKGRAAMEVDAGDELVMGELLFDGTFAELSAPVAAALASCFIALEMEKPSAAAAVASRSLPEELAFAYDRLKAAASRVAVVLADARLGPLDGGSSYVSAFSPHLMPLVFAWASGAEFTQVCALDAGLFEGTIVRVIKRLEELLTELIGAAKAMGNDRLAGTLQAACAAMHRDIVFAGSLYTLEDSAA